MASREAATTEQEKITAAPPQIMREPLRELAAKNKRGRGAPYDD
jgi:hypothetical protein